MLKLISQAFIKHVSFAKAAVPQYPIGTGHWKLMTTQPDGTEVQTGKKIE